MASRSGAAQRRSTYSTAIAATAKDSTRRRSHVIRGGQVVDRLEHAATTLTRMSAISVPLASRFDHGGLSAGARRRSNWARHVARSH